MLLFERLVVLLITLLLSFNLNKVAFF